jgi:hypothetical protein
MLSHLTDAAKSSPACRVQVFGIRELTENTSMHKFLDHVSGVSTLRQHVPAPLAKLLAAADLTAPVAGIKLDLDKLDNKLAGQPIGRRLEIKAALHAAGMLA